jgi:hypothetical protein
VRWENDSSVPDGRPLRSEHSPAPGEALRLENHWSADESKKARSIVQKKDDRAREDVKSCGDQSEQIYLASLPGLTHTPSST